jgi:hypothetical protein
VHHTHTPSSPNSSIQLKKMLPLPLTMPCSLLLCPPGGATRKVHKRYALIQKICHS